MNTRERNVAQAAPPTPNRGSPSFPKMSVQFTKAFRTLAERSAVITTLSCPVAWR